MVREDDLAAIEHALGRARMQCDTECGWAKAIWLNYRARMCASTTSCRHSLDFDWVLRGREFILTVRGTDLE
jgi:hypothetical protein